MQAAAQKLGLRIHVVQASTQRDFDTAFASVREQGDSRGESHAPGRSPSPPMRYSSAAWISLPR